MKIYSSKAYAKINLTLDVFEKNINGLHNLDSVFQTVSVFDKITVLIKNSNQKSSVISFLNGKTFDNELSQKAANLFLQKYAPNGYTVYIYIDKNIPVNAGLGGGSSDAGTVIKILLDFFKIKINDDILEFLREIGSDVPFFLYGGLCRVSGCGEKIIKLPFMLPWVFVMIKPYSGTVTKDVYSEFDRQKNKPKNFIYSEKFVESLFMNKLDFNYIHNDLENAAISLCCESVTAINDLYNLGANKVIISGSGSTVIGLFNCDSHIDLKIINNKYPYIKYCIPQY